MSKTKKLRKKRWERVAQRQKQELYQSLYGKHEQDGGQNQMPDTIKLGSLEELKDLVTSEEYTQEGEAVKSKVLGQGLPSHVVGPNNSNNSGLSGAWRVNTSSIQHLELANSLRALKKVIGVVDPAASQVGYNLSSVDPSVQKLGPHQIDVRGVAGGGVAAIKKGSSFQATIKDRGDKESSIIRVDPTFALCGGYPIPPKNFDILVGLAAHEGMHSRLKSNSTGEQVKDHILGLRINNSGLSQDEQAKVYYMVQQLGEELYTDMMLRDEFPVLGRYLLISRVAYNYPNDEWNWSDPWQAVIASLIYGHTPPFESPLLTFQVLGEMAKLSQELSQNKLLFRDVLRRRAAQYIKTADAIMALMSKDAISAKLGGSGGKQQQPPPPMITPGRGSISIKSGPSNKTDPDRSKGDNSGKDKPDTTTKNETGPGAGEDKPIPGDSEEQQGPEGKGPMDDSGSNNSNEREGPENDGIESPSNNEGEGGDSDSGDSGDSSGLGEERGDGNLQDPLPLTQQINTNGVTIDPRGSASGSQGPKGTLAELQDLYDNLHLDSTADITQILDRLLHGAGTVTEELDKRVQTSIDSAEEDITKELGDLLKESLGPRASSSLPNTVYSRGGKGEIDNSFDESLAKQLMWIMDLKNTVGKQIFRGEDRGRIDSSRLYRGSIDGLVFKQTKKRQLQKRDVVLLLDASGSMMDTNHPAYMAARAVHKVIPDSVVLTYEGNSNGVNIRQVGGKHQPFQLIDIGDRTPSGLGLLTAASRNQDSIIIHFTDGESNVGPTPYQVSHTIREKYPKVKVVNVEYLPRRLNYRFDPTEYVGEAADNMEICRIDNTSEFPTILKAALKKWVVG